jgi:hypothetical protein
MNIEDEDDVHANEVAKRLIGDIDTRFYDRDRAKSDEEYELRELWMELNTHTPLQKVESPEVLPRPRQTARRNAQRPNKFFTWLKRLFS